MAIEPYNYINYKSFYKNRPNIEDVKQINGAIFLRTQFPKTIPNNTYITSEEYLSYDLMREFLILRRLDKPLVICATSGHWEGTPLLLKTSADFEITFEDEKFIQDSIKDWGFI